MRTLVLGVIAEVFVGVGVAGIILAIAIPVLARTGVIALGDVWSSVLILGVLAVALAVALFRPGSAIRRHIKR